MAANVRIAVAGIVDIRGTLGLTRAPDGTLDIVLAQASVLVSIGGTDVARLSGYGAFTISPVSGFRLTSFRVDDFSIFPQNATDGATPGTAAPVLFPTADLASPLRNAVIRAGTVVSTIDVVFNDVNAVGLRPATITDVDAEFQLLVNGSAAGFTVSGVPTAVADKPNTWRYSFTGNLPANGVVTVRFISGSVTDTGGSGILAEDELFYLFTPTAGPDRAGADGLAGLPRQRWHHHGRPDQRPALHRRHLHEPGRHPDQEVLARGLDRTVHASPAPA